MQETGSEHWRQVITGLEGDLRGTEAAMAAVEAARAPLPLPAATGDKAAAAALAKIDARRVELLRQRDTLADAIRAAHDRRDAAEAEEEGAAAAAQAARLREASAVQVELAGQVDAAARELARALAAYSAQLMTMRRLGLHHYLANKLENKTVLAGALHLAGLSGAVTLPAVSPGHRRTRKDWTAQMLGQVTGQEVAAPRPPFIDIATAQREGQREIAARQQREEEERERARAELGPLITFQQEPRRGARG
jgi:hypothetical protein